MLASDLRVQLRSSRRVRASSYAMFAWTLYCILWLPFPVLHDAAGWHWNVDSIFLDAIYLAIAVETWRGSAIATGVSALLGAWALWRGAQGVVDVLAGAALKGTNGIVDVVARFIPVPFAIAWVLGGFAIIAARRQPEDHAAT